MNTETQHIVIIGGGFCGIMTAVHLLEKTASPLKITLINSGYPLGRGVAYSAYSSTHLLNIMAGNMSAYPNKPTDFTDWIHRRSEYSNIDKEILARTFLPRILYGEYLNEIWNKAIVNKKEGVELNIIEDIAVDAEIGEDAVVVLMKSGKNISANKLILATGNAEPKDPSIPNADFYKSADYFRNSWKKNSTTDLKSEKDILIIGSGLTMVDTVLGLIENGFTKTIYSLSPHGFGILPHRHGGIKYTGLSNELHEPYNLINLVRLTHKHIRIVRQLGLSAEPIIDSLRPHTQNIWQSLSLKERRYFLNSRLRHLWGVARHRLPVHIHDLIQNLRIQGKLVILAGNIKNIQEDKSSVLVSYYNRKTKMEENINVERVVNCTGPDGNIKKSDNTVLQNMWKRGIATADPLELGINADPQSFSIIDKYGEKLSHVFTLGTNLRGMLWESTAVPELRVQAEKLAKQLTL
ncbi:MAG TPA: FAD/NAD(P)-binding protein [Bacteroidia bacterium]|nr:FAD/NAD(P)-binding protein [Bacteroidia bacterium]